jgi:anhydro-N-acetylmuramic acid kinase
MPSQGKLVIGLMSGTSVDGIDVALARVAGSPPRLRSELLDHVALPMAASLRAGILQVAEGQRCSASEISQLNFRLGEAFAEAVLGACRKFHVPLSKIALIGSHGQTIFHQGRAVPFLGRRTASTLQVGEGAVIAARTGITTISDFRPGDIAVGGQGAPLVPYVDYLLCRHERIGRVSLNIGGIGNITVLPAGAKPRQVFAFDTGPGNMLIDALVSHFTHSREQYDKNARLARQGRAIPAILNELLGDPYLKLAPPKSTGREYYGHSYVEKLLRLGQRHGAKPKDLILTATLFTALSVVDALNRFVLPTTRIHQLVVSGGGAHNPLILAQLAAALAPIEVLPSSRLGIPEDSKEAYAFALLAYESLYRRPSNLPSATGAEHFAILGKISYAPPR